ncbi:hypothetical protein TRFO_31155 [Tritrichomonas foetus]|uniref:Uncharacterized protein n=1 Tax=Tritrichomonas foetus TaxID=1144522 RepID=A0A1J4JS84_9EUKA|nr:hypothetical protein TRFO_31155 [Tritrichomonas foetus]|eukprot:OHT01915.1 hypothetical protein TRFO_31155 [Tritrichomonas foetus]
MTRKPPTEHKIYLSASDYFSADKYLKESLMMFKTSFKGELQFIPRGPCSTGQYQAQQMKEFPKHVEEVIKQNGLTPFKDPSNPQIICCRTNALPLCDRHPKLHYTHGTKLDPHHRTIVIYPFRFKLREKQFKEKLKCWRGEFKGIVTIKPQGGYYSVNQKDLPNYIIKICKSLRIKAEISKENPAIIECDMKTLLPRRRKKRPNLNTNNQNANDQNSQNHNTNVNKELTSELDQENKNINSQADSSLNSLLINKVPPTENEIQSLTRDVEIKFNNFPRVITAKTNTEDDNKAQCASLVMVVDLQNFNVNAGGDYAWEILIWADSYKFLNIHFLTGPPSRVPLFNEPKIRKQLISMINQLASQHEIHYSYEISKHNSNLVICRHK